MNAKLKKENALYFLDRISSRFPQAKIELCFNEQDPWQLLVAVVLSAQTTDVKVNEVTPPLFKKFPNVNAFARAEPLDVEPYIKSLGFFRNKSKNLVMAARMLVEKYGGQLPREREKLEELPGVGGKSAAVIVSNAFGEPAIAVDTHVGRISRRLGLTKQMDPDKVEQELMHLFPRERWTEAHHAIIWHGRRICYARKPFCSVCPVNERCPRIGVTTAQ